mmetsp:Transcript_27947/g.41268  ORF Transcript_27947/g.41268 Transcript_27947/m.41268 type:complete len:327 (-) Transcript_27947:173-1153(-)
MLSFGNQVVNDRYVISLRSPKTLISLLLFAQIMLFWLGEETTTTTTNDEPDRRRLQGSNVDPKTIVEKSRMVDIPWKNDGDTIDLIVNICKESMDTVFEVASQLQVNRVFIYSKCGIKTVSAAENDILLSKGITVYFRQLRNVGKEGHAWLHHMLRNNQTSSGEEVEEPMFADWSLFLQAKPHATVDIILNAYQHIQTLSENVNFVDLSQYHFTTCGRPVILDNSSQILSPQPRIQEYSRYWCPWHQEFVSSDPCSTAKISILGEFLASRALLLQQSPEQLKTLKTKFETTRTFKQESDSVRFGYFLERWWINILNATDSCSAVSK